MTKKEEIRVIDGFDVKIGVTTQGQRVIGLRIRMLDSPHIEFLLEKSEAHALGQALLGACAYKPTPEEKAAVDRIIQKQVVH